MKYLIVSADDFGFSKTINEGIAKAYREGIATNLCLMPTGEAFDDALVLAKGLGLREMGAHLTLTGTAPSLDPGKVPTLVAGENRFYRDNTAFFINLLLKRIDTAQIYLELKNQLDRLREVGIRITNLSSHENIHMIPGILDIFIRLAREYGTPSIRCLRREDIPAPFGVKRLYKKIVISYFGDGMGGALKKSGIAVTDHFLGFLDSGDIREDNLLTMIHSLRDGATELVSHPGFLSPGLLAEHKFYRNCEAELAALVSRRVKRAIGYEGIRLVTYGDLTGPVRDSARGAL